MTSQLRPSESLHLVKDSFEIGPLGVVVDSDALPSITDSSQVTVAKPATSVDLAPVDRVALMFCVNGYMFASEHGLVLVLQSVVSAVAVPAPTMTVRAAAAIAASSKARRCFMMSPLSGTKGRLRYGHC